MRLAAICIAAAILLAGCSGDDAESTATPEAPASSVASTEEPGKTPDIPSGEAPSAFPKSRGADAAPGDPNPTHDASQTATDNYASWLLYEMNAPGDLNRSFEKEAYPDGIFVCMHLRMNGAGSIKPAMTVLTEANGWSGTGAAAIIKGALNSLCPWMNQGYMTDFDKNVDRATQTLSTALTWTNGLPPFYEVGYFSRNVCTYLATNKSADGLEAFLHLFRTNAEMKATHAGTFIGRFGNEDQLLRRATHKVVFATCLGNEDWLNDYWRLA